jgi:hypothetical protein
VHDLENNNVGWAGSSSPTTVVKMWGMLKTVIDGVENEC